MTGPHAISVSRTEGSDPAIPLPAYETDKAAGMDVRANLGIDLRPTGMILAPGQRALVPTGLAVAVPEGCEIQVRPRSGLALRRGVTLVNSPGTIDADYRGEVGVILMNTGEEPFHIRHGDRIAQLVLAPVLRAQWVLSDSLDATARGTGGFGSTGV